MRTYVNYIICISVFCWNWCLQLNSIAYIHYWSENVQKLHNIFIFKGHFYRAACNADAVLWWEFCLSVCHTRVLWQNGRKICPDLYTIRKNIYPSFL